MRVDLISFVFIIIMLNKFAVDILNRLQNKERVLNSAVFLFFNLQLRHLSTDMENCIFI